MNLLATALIALTTLDILMQQVEPPPAVNDVYHATTGAGELQVTVQEMPIEGTVARGSTRVPLLTLNLSASCDADITVNEIRLTRTGLGSSRDLDGVFLSDDSRRLTRVVTFDSRGSANLRLQKVTISRCGSVRILGMVNVSKTAAPASEHGLTVSAASDIASTAETVRIVRDAQPVVVKAAPMDTGTISVNFLTVPGRLRYGRREIVARLQISADSTSDHLLKSITLTNEESARDAQLTDFVIETVAGKPLTRVGQRMTGKKVTLFFEPSFLLKRSQTLVLPVKADMRASNVKIRFVLEEPSDLEAKQYRGR